MLITLTCLVALIFTTGKSESHKSSLFGKYRELVTTIDCPLPKTSLKEFEHFGFKEYGFFKGGKWCGTAKAPAGYYVYVSPKWYVWRKESKKKLPPSKLASVNGKYNKLVKKINCPGHSKFYKKFTEYGYQEPWVWCSVKSKPGHYVYVYPDWYIWKDLKKDNIPPAAKDHTEYKYRYSKLLQVIPCGKDEKQYGGHYEYGPYDQGHVYCGLRSRKGFWVYVAPNWYVWKDRKKKDLTSDREYENWPPR